jgi:hypothetical protein
VDRRKNVRQEGTGGNTPERRSELQRLALGWLKFLTFVERQRRLDAGEPVVRLVRDDAA